MNILVISNFFSLFYTSLASYLNTKGIKTTIHIASFENEGIDTEYSFHLKLPEYGRYTSSLNKATILKYVKENNINLILFPQISDVGDLIDSIKEVDKTIACLFLLHSCPNLVVANKREQFKRLKLRNISSVKLLFAWGCPRLYLLILKKLWRRWAIRQYNSFDKIIVLSPSYVEEYRQIIGNIDFYSKILAIPNPRIEYKSQISIYKKKKQIVYVGRLGEEKAVYRLLQIWKRIYKLLPEWNLVLVGDGETRLENESFVKVQALERVEFLGIQKSIPVIDESAILCITSNIEGLPTVFMEAMSLGVIPIGFNSFSAIYDMIDNNVSGIIIPAFDEELYANALIQLALNENLRYHMAEMAQQKVNQYDIENIGQKWLCLFKELNLL
ncbi:glycosyltransferase [Parabacteroides gordonii]|uniref:glycosyltransferase n=1 Tax=Parabacteroides gordonii TaxID=574930 RepID=UPI00241D15D2|nr:glycosyltransferase [Parabacteroides gordonii]